MSTTKAKQNFDVFVYCPVVGFELAVTTKDYLSSVTKFGHFNEATSPLSRIMAEAPYFPRCSSDKTATLVRPREFAVRYPYMQVNRKDWVSWLVFDLDHENSWIWEDANLPEPNLVVSNPKSGTSHLFYAISPVYTGDNARRRPIKYMKAVYEAMALALDADLSYRGPVAKTPGHKWWRTSELHSYEYQLDELAQSHGIELLSVFPWSKRPGLDAVSHSRHCVLFEDVRHYAYRIINTERAFGTFERFKKRVQSYATTRNRFRKIGFSQNLSTSQVNATVKSICSWTWDKYTGGVNCHRGILRLDSTLPLNERQSKGARYTNSKRRRNSEAQIKAAWCKLKQLGKKATTVAISQISGLSRQTVAKYSDYLDSLYSTTDIIPLKNVLCDASVARSKSVNYGVHQITARVGQLKNAEPGIEMLRNNKVCTVNKEFVHKWFWNNKVCTQRKELSPINSLVPSGDLPPDSDFFWMIGLVYKPYLSRPS